jgi:phage terminase large subunit GpA-like protein
MNWTEQELSILRSSIRFERPMRVWEWADEKVFYPDTYPTEFKGRFNSGFMPFYRQILDWCINPDVREVSILKCSQSMCTGTVAENLIRYNVARQPCDMLYIGGQQEVTEKMFEARIKKGLEVCSEETSEMMRKAKARGMDIFFPRMILSAIWSSSMQGIKSFSYRVVICDEVSLFDDVGVVDKARKRLETAPFSKLIKMSAMDKLKGRGASDDPMLIEFRSSTQCEWMMPDPGATENLFKFEMGFRDKDRAIESPHGLKWDINAYDKMTGTWDRERVLETAHYVTPGGAIITNETKNAAVDSGQWVSQNKAALEEHQGARITRWMLPFSNFKDMARKFYQVLELGKPALRVFVLEDLAEEWVDDKQEATEDDLSGRVGAYLRGERMSQSLALIPGENVTYKDFYVGRPTEVLMAVDVQKDHFRVVSREWVKGGDSGLLWFGPVIEWALLDKLATEHGATYCFMDNTYPERRQEVFENCWELRGFIPCIFKDARMVQTWTSSVINPFEGHRRQSEGNQLMVITFDRDYFLSNLTEMIAGRKLTPSQPAPRWSTYAGVEREYRREVTAMERRNGVWTQKRGQPQDHYNACEILQVLGATFRGLMQTSVQVDGR